MATPEPLRDPQLSPAAEPATQPVAAPVAQAPSSPLAELTLAGVTTAPAIAHAIRDWSPARREVLMAELQRSHGNAFVGQVMSLLPKESSAATLGRGSDTASFGTKPKAAEEPAAATPAETPAATAAPAATSASSTPLTSHAVDGALGLDARGAVESASLTASHDTVTSPGGSGQQLTGGLKVTADSTELSAGMTRMGDEQPEDAANPTRAETKHGATLTNGPDGPSIGVTTSDTARTATGGVTTTAGMTLSATGMTADGGTAVTSKDAAGTTTVDKGGGRLAFSDGSIVVGANGSREVTREDGSAHSTGGSGSIDLAKGSASGTATTSRTGTDGMIRGGSVSGTLGKDEQALSGTVERGSQQFALSGGAGIKHSGTMAAPVQRPDGKWVVSYSIVWGGNASVGGRGAAPDSSAVSGLSGSGSVAGSMASTSSGERVFASEAEATAFQVRGEFGATELPTGAAAALALAEGQVISDGTSSNVGGGLGAGAGGLSLSVGLELGRTSGLRVERGSGSTLVATLSNEEMASVSAGLGGPLMAMRFGKSWGERSWQTVSFDLSTASGQLAYEQLAQSRTLPATGWTVVSTGAATSEGSSMGVSVPLLGNVSTGGQTSEVVSTDAAGAVTETSIGAQTSGVNITGLGHATESHSLSVSDSAAGRTVLAESVVDSSWAEDASMQLASATGTHSNPTDADSAGKWTVSTALPPEQLAAFAKAVETGAFNPTDRGGGNATIHTEYILDLRAALLAAGKDQDARRKAMAAFIDNGGDVALDQLMTFGDATPDHFLTLEGDATFLGVAGHERLNSQLGDLERRLADPAADRPGIVAGLEDIRRGSLQRLANLRDPVKYTELPKELRAEESGRLETQLARSEELMGRAARMPAPAPLPGAAPAAKPAPDPGAFERGIQTTLVKSRREEAYGLRDLVERTRYIHEERHAMYSPRRDLDDGIILAGAEGPAYARIDDLGKRAARSLADAESAERDSLLPDLSGADRDRLLTTAKGSFEAASRSYHLMMSEYEGIVLRHPEQQDKWAKHHVTVAPASQDAGGIWGGMSD